MTLDVISLGWGVQSTTMCFMVALGELPMVDYAIHSDTHYERRATYDFAKKWTPWLIEHGVNIVTLGTDPKDQFIGRDGCVDMPVWTDINGKIGRLRRQCTHDWKVVPIRRYLRDKRSYIPWPVRRKEPVNMWLGITTDEAERMSVSRVGYITNIYPLIERRISREDCKRWLVDHGFEVPVRSSCVFCPYKTRQSWIDMREENGRDWQVAYEVDSAIRNVRPPHPLYIHQNAKPLNEALDAYKPDKDLQLNLWQDECSGHCGI